MNEKTKAILAAALLSFVSELSGCTAPPKHTTTEISGVSISCGHMNRSYGYSFWVRADNSSMLFDADCYTGNYEIPTVLESVEISNDEYAELMKIIEEAQLIQYAENYKKPPKSPVFVSDETTYCFSLTFTDGENYLTYNRQEELENYFYALAEKYAETHNIADDDLIGESYEEE